MSGIGFIWLSNDTGKYVLTPLACIPSKSLAFEANPGAGRWQALNCHPLPPQRHTSINIRTATQSCSAQFSFQTVATGTNLNAKRKTKGKTSGERKGYQESFETVFEFSLPRLT